MYRIVFTKSYDKKAGRFLKEYPDLKKQYVKTLELLEANPFHPSLRLHRLKGRLNKLHSVSINLAYRIVIEFIIQDDMIIPIDIGSHEEVYE